VTITLPSTSNVLGLGFPPFIDPLASGNVDNIHRVFVIQACAFAGSSSNTATSSSFIPAKNELLVACVSLDSSASTDPLSTCSDSLGGTWTRNRNCASGDGDTPSASGAASVFTRPVGINDVTAMTVTASGDVALCGAISFVVYRVSTRDGSLPLTGATGHGTSSANKFTAALTSTFDYSTLLLAALDWGALGAPSSPELTYISGTQGGFISWIQGYRYLGPKGAQSVTIDGFGTSTTEWRWAALEIYAGQSVEQTVIANVIVDGIVGSGGPSSDVTATVTAGSSVIGVSGDIGAVTQAITAGSNVIGVSGDVGTVTQAITVGSSVVGVSGDVGTVTQAVTVGFSVIGVVGTIGVVTATETATHSVVGSIGGAQPQGQITQTLTAASTVVGTVQTFGAVTQAITVGSSVVGIVAKTGVVTATETAAHSVVGSVISGVTGSVTAVETAASTIVGAVAAFGAVTQTLTAASTVVGVVAKSGVVTATETAGYNVVGSTTAGVIGQVTQTIIAGASVAGLCGALGNASPAIAAGATVTARTDGTGSVIASVASVYTVVAQRAISTPVSAPISISAIVIAYVVGTYGYSRIGTDSPGIAYAAVGSSNGPYGTADSKTDAPHGHDGTGILSEGYVGSTDMPHGTIGEGVS